MGVYMIDESMQSFELESVHKSKIMAGDTIYHNGRLMTVCRCDISLDSFMGICIFGDSYKLGTANVTRALLNPITGV